MAFDATMAARWREHVRRGGSYGHGSRASLGPPHYGDDSGNEAGTSQNEADTLRLEAISGGALTDPKPDPQRTPGALILTITSALRMRIRIRMHKRRRTRSYAVAVNTDHR